MQEKTIYTEKDVVEKFGRGLPKYRKETKGTGYVRSFDKTDRAEMKAVQDWLAGDDEFRRLVDVYACYCRILVRRGYGSAHDKCVILDDHPGLVEKLCLSFAKSETDYIWHDLVTSTRGIMTGDGADGYWPFLDREYLDISHMRVGNAIINLDEVWAVVTETLREFIHKCVNREHGLALGQSVACDRCGKAVLNPRKARFDPYENLLHCARCAEECTHWKGHGK